MIDFQTIEIKFSHATKSLINEISKEYAPIAKAIYGKKVGEFGQLEMSFMQANKELEVLEIIDKYQGLLRTIIEEQATEKLSTNHVRIEGDDIEIINKQLVTIFGLEGSILKETNEKLLNDYIIGSSSFSDLVKNMGHNPLSVYYKLTSSSRIGLSVASLSLFKNFTLEKNTEFVLDSTSLLLFFQLSEAIGLKFQQKFWISKVLIELIEKELYKTQSGKESTISIQVTMEGVIPYLLPQGNRTSNINFLKKLLDWIDKNCQTKLVKEKLDLVARLRAKRGDVNDYADSVIDTIFLASFSNMVLISDDSMYGKILLPKKQQISTELFLRNKFIKTHNINIIPLLVQMNYKGIKIPKKFIFKELNKHINGESNLFFGCLENISLINQSSHMATWVVELTRKVYYSNHILLGRKAILAQHIFAKSLKGVKRNTNNEDFIKKIIWKLFQFLPNQLDAVAKDFDIVWKRYG